MKIALFRCCNTNICLKHNESVMDSVLKGLDVEAVDVKEFGCCGYPLKNIELKAYILCSARNLSLAEEKGLNIITFCSCCYSSLKRANHLMKEDVSIQKEINTTLEKEGLRYDGGVEVKHFLDIVYKDIGIKNIKEKIAKTFKGLKIATHYGCQLLKPRQIMKFDNPAAPSKFDELVEITGAKSILWPTKLQCCGAPTWGINDDLSMDLMERKIRDAGQSGADFLCTACPFCQLQFDKVQKMLVSKRNLKHYLPAILYPQLLGLSLGIDAGVLGIDKNELDLTGIMDFLQ